MAGFSDYMEKAIIRFLVKRNKDAAGALQLGAGGAIVTPSLVAISLHGSVPDDVGSTELANSNGYARVSVTTDIDDALGNVVAFQQTAVNGNAWGVTNKAVIQFPTATGPWNSSSAIGGWGMWDSATYGAGNFLFGGTITGTVIVTTGVQPSFALNQLSLTLD